MTNPSKLNPVDYTPDERRRADALIAEGKCGRIRSEGPHWMNYIAPDSPELTRLNRLVDGGYVMVEVGYDGVQVVIPTQKAVDAGLVPCCYVDCEVLERMPTSEHAEYQYHHRRCRRCGFQWWRGVKKGYNDDGTKEQPKENHV